MVSESLVPPGSRVSIWGMFLSERQAATVSACVDLPAPSTPSKVIKRAFTEMPLLGLSGNPLDGLIDNDAQPADVLPGCLKSNGYRLPWPQNTRRYLERAGQPLLLLHSLA